jgi:hypothetical protein
MCIGQGDCNSRGVKSWRSAFCHWNLPWTIAWEISESDNHRLQLTVTNLDTNHQTMANTTKLASPRTDSSRRQSALPQIHKLWECFGHTFGDREKYSEDDDDTELTHNFFYGGGESALDDFDKIYDDDEYFAEERPRPKHNRKAVTSTSRSPICVDDFVDFASEVGKSTKVLSCSRYWRAGSLLFVTCINAVVMLVFDSIATCRSTSHSGHLLVD